MSIIEKAKLRHTTNKEEVMTLSDFIDLIKVDPSTYATPSERMLKAIGEPEIIHTSKDEKLKRLFNNRVIRMYKPFHDFFGMETVIEKVVSYFRSSAQNLEERRQILYLLGGVGSAKSSLAERLKKLMEQEPIYVLITDTERSPVFETPLGLFSKSDAEELGVPKHVLTERLSPWALKRLKEFEGDITKFKVLKTYPSQSKQIGITKTEPGDENNQDISALVGKTDIRKLAKFAQNDPDSYSFSGGLCLANQGMLEFVEMFKAPIKVLHPLLTATQEGNFNGTEALSAIPFDGIILAHSNEAEWQTFRNNKSNEAFIDRVCVIKVPYTLRETEEVKIYKKLIHNSSLSTAPCAPETLNILAKFSVLSRLAGNAGTDLYTKLKVYDGMNMKDNDPKAKTAEEYRTEAGVDEGMTGISTRFAFKVLSKVFNHNPDEVSADPAQLFFVLEKAIIDEQFPKDTEEKLRTFINSYLKMDYLKKLESDIQKSYLDSYDAYGQNLFDRYIKFADFWVSDSDYLDDATGQVLNRHALNKELEPIEKAAGIANPKDFRSEVVTFVLRARANNKGVCDWKSYEKLRAVLEKSMFTRTNDLLPIISFDEKASKEDQKKHTEFMERMIERGYTKKQCETLVRWYIQHKGN